MPVLVRVTGDPAGQLIELRDEELIIGRLPECAIVLDPHGVSRRHARIAREGNDFYIVDLNSRNTGALKDTRFFAFDVFGAVDAGRGMPEQDRWYYEQYRGERRCNIRMLVEHRLAHDRDRRIHDLRALVIAERRQVKRRKLAVGAIGHGGVDTGNTLGGGAQCRRRVAARQRQELFRSQLKAVSLLEGGHGRRALDELGRGGELEATAFAKIGREVI